MSDADSAESSIRHRFSPKLRLRRRSEIRAVFDTGVRIHGRLLVVWAVPGTQESKVVVVAGRRVGGAVARNRAKRLLREAYRLIRHRLKGACHLALVARSECAQASRPEVEVELLALLDRAECTGSGIGSGSQSPRTEPAP